MVRTLSTILSQDVEDELLQANRALRLGRHLRAGVEPETAVDPFGREDVKHLLNVGRRITSADA